MTANAFGLNRRLSKASGAIVLADDALLAWLAEFRRLRALTDATFDGLGVLTHVEDDCAEYVRWLAQPGIDDASKALIDHVQDALHVGLPRRRRR